MKPAGSGISGVQGVSYDKSKRRWFTYTYQDGETRRVARFKTLKEAVDSKGADRTR